MSPVHTRPAAQRNSLLAKQLAMVVLHLALHPPLGLASGPRLAQARHCERWAAAPARAARLHRDALDRQLVPRGSDRARIGSPASTAGELANARRP